MTLVAGFQTGKDDRSGIELAATLARSSGQDLLMVTVVPAPWPTPVAAHTDREFEAWAAQLGETGVAEVEALLAEHCPDVPAVARWTPHRSVPRALLDQADEVGAAMIVIGAGSTGSYGHVYLGSTGHRLLHSSRVPVAIATRGYSATDHGRVRRVTCAFRGDDASRRTLERTAAICAEIGASLRVATFAVRGRTMYPPEVGTRAEDMVLEAWVAQAAAAQEQAVADLQRSGETTADIETVIASGRTWATTIDRLPWDRDEVLVVGSSSAGLMERIFLGSNASKIVRHAPVPVVAVP
jgi:nucleotide-binding universal stress UspA family protein